MSISLSTHIRNSTHSNIVIPNNFLSVLLFGGHLKALTEGKTPIKALAPPPRQLSFNKLLSPLLFLPILRRLSAGPKRRTLSSTGGPCLSAASWSALPRPAYAYSVESGRGVCVNDASQRARPLLGHFSGTTTGAPFGTRQATSSAAGPNPGLSRTFTSFPVSNMWWKSERFSL